MFTLSSYRAQIPSPITETFSKPGVGESLAQWRSKDWKRRGVIGGWWRSRLIEIEKMPHMLERFLACASEEGTIRAYTQRHGVLRFRWIMGTYFEFTPGDWVSLQEELRHQWASATNGQVSSVLKWIEGQLTLEQKEVEDAFEPYVRYSEMTSPALTLGLWIRAVRGSSGIECRTVAGDLWQGLCLSLLEKLQEHHGSFRICANTSCKGQKYFIATRHDQKCCDASCSKLVADRNYWNKRGKDLRQKSRKEEKNNGSRKKR